MKSWLEHLEERKISNVPLNTRISLERWSEPLHNDYAIRTRLMLKAGVEFTWREGIGEYEKLKEIALQKLHRTLFEGIDTQLYELYEAVAQGSRHEAFDIIDKILNMITGRDIHE